MKILKFNESLNEGFPEEGDYVIIYDYVDYHDIDSNTQRNYLNSHIGKVYRIRTRKRNGNIIYDIEYKDAPVHVNKLLSQSYDDNNDTIYIEMSRDPCEIEYWSKYIHELELILKMKKFNI